MLLNPSFIKINLPGEQNPTRESRRRSLPREVIDLQEIRTVGIYYGMI